MGSNVIRKILLDKNISISEFADMLSNEGFSISKNVLSNKLSRDTFSLNEYILFCNVLGCQVRTISENENINYLNECDKEKEYHKKMNLKANK